MTSVFVDSNEGSVYLLPGYCLFKKTGNKYTNDLIVCLLFGMKDILLFPGI